MANRIAHMRELLVAQLKKAGSTRNWSHITRQIGMFCYTGLTEAECQDLMKNHHVYLTLNGRISLAGVTEANVKQLAEAIHSVTVQSRRSVEDDTKGDKTDEVSGKKKTKEEAVSSLYTLGDLGI